jgi:hypothetical protein
VVIAIDGKYGVPLRVAVFAKDAASPAVQVGFTQIAFVTPAAANLHFTAPAGAKITKVNLAMGRSGLSGQAVAAGNQDTSGFGTYGSGWLTVVELPESAISMAGPTGSAQIGTGALGSETQGMLHALAQAAKPVHGSWGSGTLLTSGLMSVLTTHGEIYIGAVEPSVLYAAVGHAS